MLVRIRRAGVRGTDLLIYESSHPFLAYPRVIGHELSGEIAATGPGCAIAPGQQVYVIPYLACGTCVACRHGKTNCCQHIGVLGVHVDGGMAQVICVPERNVVAADGVTLDQAAMVEFLAIGAHAVGRANPKSTDRVLVVGAGPIGIGCILFAKLRGASVTVLDMREDRLGFCRQRLGADHLVSAGADAAVGLSQLTDGDFFDVVIDATGSAKPMMAGFGYVAHGGTYAGRNRRPTPFPSTTPGAGVSEATLLASRARVPHPFTSRFARARRPACRPSPDVTHAPRQQARRQ